MQSLILALLLLQSPVAPVQVPALPSPTRESLPNTPAELAVLRAGDALYDQGKFDDAMNRYDEVLKSNPDNVSAMHQLADTLFQKHEYQKAVDLAIKGLEFRSSIRPLFYVLIGNTLDTTGQPQRAVDVYKSGLAIAPGSGILHYNLGVTLTTSLKDAAQGRNAFKQGALADPTYPGIQFQLAVSFAMDDL
jgi:tetratricopeptide (TPR) repeat protein